MADLAVEFRKSIEPGAPDSLVKEFLNQAARELLLAESSDWPFILKTGTMAPYADKRIKNHIGRFTKIYEDLKNNNMDNNWLDEVMNRDSIFYDIDCAEFYLPEKITSTQVKEFSVKTGRKTRKQ